MIVRRTANLKQLSSLPIVGRGPSPDKGVRYVPPHGGSISLGNGRMFCIGVTLTKCNVRRFNKAELDPKHG